MTNFIVAAFSDQHERVFFGILFRSAYFIGYYQLTILLKFDSLIIGLKITTRHALPFTFKPMGDSVLLVIITASYKNYRQQEQKKN